MNNSGTNIHVPVFVRTYIFNFLEYTTKSEIVVSHGNSMFNSFRNCQTVFQSSCTILYSYQLCMRVPISPHPCQHLLFSVFLIIAIIVSVKWYLIVVIICISLMANDIEHLFMCLLAIFISSSEKCLFEHFALFYIGLFVFLLLSCKRFLHILDTRSLSDI